MQWIWFGTPGDLSKLVRPRSGIQAPRDQRSQAITLAGGGTVVHTLPLGLRTYTLSWDSLEYANHTTLAVLEEYVYGLRGQGPFALLDPGRTNLLTTNQSSATGALSATTGFTATGTGWSVASSTTLAKRGTRSLAWSLASGSAAGALTLAAAAPWWSGVPVVVGLTYSFRAQGRLSSAPTVTAAAGIDWLDSAGSILSTSSGAGVAPGSGAWSALDASGAAPAGAVYARPRLDVAAGAAGAGSVLLLDELQLEVAAAPSTWRPGTGVYPMAVLGGMDETQPWADPGYRQGVTLTLQEVGQ